MKKTVLLTVIMGLFFACDLMAQAPGDTLWTRTYGGINDDASYSIEQTTDGGFIIAGKTYSFGAGDEDAYLIKTDASGDTLWTRTYGGINSDFAKSVKQTNDEGYIFVGATYSFGAAVQDAWLVKTDSNGNTLWMQTYGGNYWDAGWSVQQTDDGGYIFVGSTTYNWQNDIYLVRTDAVGDTLWTKTFGGGQNDYGREIQKTTDGGYIIVGKIFSVESNSYDVYLLKIDDNGNTIWERTYGGSGRDEGWSVKQTSDNGFIIAGSTKSFGAGEEDMYLIKADVDGNELWSHSYGGSLYDVCNYVNQTIDGGYILLGGTTSFGAGSYDVYLVKVNFNGDTLWTRTYGSDGQEEGWAVLQDNYDGNYLVSGKTFSFGAGGSDVWLLKIYNITTAIEDNNPFSSKTHSLFQNYPNPFNSSTTISFSVEGSDKNTFITIYNFNGQKIKTLTNKVFEEGSHQVIWDGTDDSGNSVGSGIYFYKMKHGNKYSGFKKMILMK